MKSSYHLKFYLIIIFSFYIINVRGQSSDSIIIRKFFSEALSNSKAYTWLDELVNGIGGRLSGSPEAAKAVEWAEKKMHEAGADTVFLQPVMVPHWVRGEKEVGKIIDKGNSQAVPVTALGGSVATRKEGITATIVEVHDFDELKKLGAEKIKGKIVFYNHPFNEKFIDQFNAYGEAVTPGLRR